MKNIIFILILIFCSTFLFSQTIIPGGNVSGNWSISGSPYLVEGEITIPDGQTLTIDPGCLIEFQGHYKFNIQGRLLSIGTEQDSIRFTINDTTGFYIPHVPDGGWDGLHFESLITVNDSSKIKYSIFEYGKAIGSYYENSRGGAIKCYSNFCRLIIENCLFINNYSSYFGGAIYCCISNVKIIGNRFENNLSSSRGGAVSYTSAGEISNNLFVNNRAGYGGALYLTHSSCIVNGNKFTNNYSYHGGAVCLYNSNDDLVLINNIMCNNSARFGGGCYFFQTDGILINNTIVNNHDWFAGGLHFEASNGLVNVYNSIIYGNDCQYGFMQVMIDYGGSDPNFYNCNIQGGIEGFSIYGDDSNYVGDYIDNIDYPPMFVDPSSGTGNDVIGYDADWSLLSSSVCINHGIVDTTGLNLPDTDYAGNPRIYCGIDPRVDIGAYEYQGEPDPIPGIMINPKLLDFGIHTINTTSEVKNISIWNIGFSSLEINNITASAGFLIKRDNYPQFGSFITPFSVEPDSTEIINVIFEPLAAGYYEDNIVIYSNDSNFPVSYVNVNGIGDNWPIFQGVLEEDTFWDTDTVKVIGSVIVDSGVTLCVEPGTNVQIFEDCSLFIQGSIIAEGTIDDSIIFTGVQNYYYADCWGGLKFNQTPTINDSSKFNYCIFSNSKSDFGGALFIQDFSKVYFKNCTFKYNIAEQDNNCGYGGGMTLMNSSPLISNCVFKNNIASGGWYSFGRGGGIAIINSSPIITNCIFSNNTAEGGYPNNCGGGIYCVSCSNLVISETVISNNSAGYNTGYDWSGGGVYCDDSSLIIISSLIVNNFSGGGICLSWGSNPTIINSTIAYNTGIGLNCNCSPNIINNILWSNDNQVNIVQDSANPNFYYCDIQGGIDAFIGNGVIGYNGIYDNNIDENPAFINPLNGNYQLQDSSPCIDTGTPSGWILPDTTMTINDLLGYEPYGAAYDIGAYEWQGTGISNDELVILNYELSNYPNPFNPSTEISFNLTAKNAKDAEIEIYNMRGQKVKTLTIIPYLSSRTEPRNEGRPNQSSVTWNSTDQNNKPVGSGIYFYQLKVYGQTKASKKMLLLK